MLHYKHIRLQITFTLMSATLVALLLGLMPLRANVDKQAQQMTEQQMHAGERVLIHLLQENAQSLKQSARLLASDERVSHALLAQDETTLNTWLSQQQDEQSLEAVYFVGADNQVIGVNRAEPEDSNTINNLIKQITSKKIGHLHFMPLQKMPYQWVAIEVKTPVMGWLVLGKKIDVNLAKQYQALSHLDLSLIQKGEDNHWQMVGTTLSPTISNRLMKALAGTYTHKYQLKTMTYSDKQYQLKSRTLYQDQNTALLAIIQKPSQASNSWYAETKWTLLGLLVLVVGVVVSAIAYVSKVMTMPLNEIIENIKMIAQGNYLKKLNISRPDALGQLGHALNEMQDAIAMREDKVHALAYEDALTELANRLGFMQALNRAIQDHEKTLSTLSVLVINIHRFKQINTTLGRAFGDEVLCYVAKAIEQLLPAKQGLVARLDADEFAVILHNADQEKATSFASALYTLFEQPVLVDAQQIDLHIAIGISLFPSHANTEEKLLHQAEIAQQTAKQKKTPWIVYNSALEIDHTDQLKMMTELKEAIKHNQLVMYLQPKVNTKTRALMGAEALVRWVHPSHGMMLPEQFIPFVEHTPTMTHLTYWLIEEACKVMLAFKQQLIPLNISVNLSSRDINNLDLPNQIQKRMQAHGLSPKALHLEMTENALMDDPIRATTVVRALADLGIHLAIDDFGTGYSSLSYLRELPVKELKIDKSFVKEMHRNLSDKAIVRSTIDLGHHLGLKVVAEGIESEETINQLAALGCDEGQGYYISKPMPVRDFGIWLERWNNEVSQMEYALELEIKGSLLDFVATSIRPSLEIAREKEAIKKEDTEMAV